MGTQRTDSLRRLFRAPKTYVTAYGYENINIFMLNFFSSRPMFNMISNKNIDGSTFSPIYAEPIQPLLFEH